MVDILKEIGEPVSAADWQIALREQPNDMELIERFEAWLIADPVRQGEWDQLHSMTSMFKQLPDEGREILEEDLVGTLGKGRFVRKSRLAFMMLGVVMAVLVLVYVRGFEVIPGSVYETGTGQSLTVELKDGSTVVLGADTKFSAVLNGNPRRVQLHTGRAFFTVMRDESKPFVVSANGFEVTVLGTAFEVASRKELSQVVVANGKVAVKDQQSVQAYELKAGDLLKRQGLVGAWRQDEVHPSNIARWRDGLFVAQNNKLSAFVSELSAYHQGLIYLSDDVLEDMPVTGVFDLKQPEKALDILARSHPIKVQKLTPWIFLLSVK